MRNSSSKERLDILHQALDRQLESINRKPTILKKNKEDLNQFAEKRTLQQNTLKNSIQKSHKNEINQLQKKLQDLQKKFDDFSDSQGEQLDRQINEKLQIQRFGTKKNQNVIKNKQKAKQRYKQKQQQKQSSQQDSFDYYAVSKTQPFKQKYMKQQIKILQQPKQNQNLIKSIYTNEKKQTTQRLNRSEVSKKSMSKQNFSRRNSKQSIKSNKKRNISSKKQFDNISLKSFQPNPVSSDKIKIKNLQLQLNHYKRLSVKLKLKIQQMHIHEIQYRQLKNNFVKSEQIRFQQKKIIKNLKQKLK